MTSRTTTAKLLSQSQTLTSRDLNRPAIIKKAPVLKLNLTKTAIASPKTIATSPKNQINSKSVISLESRRPCPLHGYLTDFVCLSCAKETCSQCLCSSLNHQIVSLQNFYELVHSCLQKHVGMKHQMDAFTSNSARSVQ